ncbi:glycoside hydrolase superfamily [Tricharina praecox]|uniref:glycoside hydrolase superfamily n=1 Tax=Tricharina praecox TaxID=43433 RepID=UPI00221ECF15|nr:glycoside hydrolase superfamily [Tricharina praecox]KAI5851796.1 glycoside hydrolase superfamily [Tricharina praecox]
MKLSILVAVASVFPTLSSCHAYFAGFNLPHNTASGGCKTTQDWRREFATLKSWSTGGKGNFDTVKIFSTSGCDALSNAVPAAMETGIKLWVGVWNTPSWKFDVDKAALESAIRRYPDTRRWLRGINVGSESLYTRQVTAAELVGQIKDVKGMIHKTLKSPWTPIGTADTWNVLVDPANRAVTDVSNVVVMNAFPFWEGIHIDGALERLKFNIRETRKAIGWEKFFIIGETGWPTDGRDFGAATPSIRNQQKYWKTAACWLQTTSYPWLWFEGFDEPSKADSADKLDYERSFASNFQKPKFDLHC